MVPGQVMEGKRRVGRWRADRRDEWRAVRQIMRDAQSQAWLRLTHRMITHPGRDLAEWACTRTLIEALHAERTPVGRGAL